MVEYITLCQRLHNLPDPRDKDHVIYTLPEVLFVVYASILSARLFGALALQREGLWSGLKQCAVIQRDRLTGLNKTTEVDFYISSRELLAESTLASVRHHWSIENGQHRTPDVSFGEDASKIHERTAAKAYGLNL